VHSLTTGKADTVLSLRPESETVKPGEVFYVPVEFTGRDGILQPYMEQRVDLSVENAVLLGFGSALYKTDEVFDKTYHETYRGRALAVLRAGEKGLVTITAQSNGVQNTAVKVEVI
jgi:beta-galactosidase